MQVSLTWPAVRGATYYELEISKNSSFIASKSITINVPVAKIESEPGRYFWRVRPVTSDRASKWLFNQFTVE